MGVAYQEYNSRACEFCPKAVDDGQAITVAQLGSIDGLASQEIVTNKRFKYGWMAGGSGHKLSMLKEVLGKYPGLLHVENLYPMKKLKNKGVAVTKHTEDTQEKSGTTIAKDKLEAYWKPFVQFEKTLSCRRYGPQGSPSDGCQQDHFMFASDVNVWANINGEKRSAGVCLRNPDEEFVDWETFNESQKRDAIIHYMTGQYRQIGGSEWVTNTVESALVFRRPLDPDWGKYLDAEGASKMYVTMPLELLQDEDFVDMYLDHVIESAIGTSRSQMTGKGVLNNIGGAAGGILMEKMIEIMRIHGYEVPITFPPVSKSSRRFAVEAGTLTEWDSVRGHAMGIPHILTCELLTDFVKRKSPRGGQNPVELHGSNVFMPSRADIEGIGSTLWKQG